MSPSQNIYIALLRAINVGGNAVIKMADLKKRVESLGLSDVSTYIQTGNVLFTSKETDAKSWKPCSKRESGTSSNMT